MKLREDGKIKDEQQKKQVKQVSWGWGGWDEEMVHQYQCRKSSDFVTSQLHCTAYILISLANALIVEGVSRKGVNAGG